MTKHEGGEAWLAGMLMNLQLMGQWTPETEAELRAEQRVQSLKRQRDLADRAQQLQSQLDDRRSFHDPTRREIQEARHGPDGKQTWLEVADSFGVSESTLWRRRKVLGMTGK